MRVGAFVMTYRRPEVARDTVARLLAQTRPPDQLLILDNSALGGEASLAALCADPRVEYRDLGDNLGPAGSSAIGVSALVERGFDWIYWIDDDDPPARPDVLERLLALAAGAGSVDLAAVAAVGQRWDWRRGRVVRLRDDELTGVVAVDVIGGGMQLLLNRQALLQIGAPDRKLFFAFEDYELCLRARRAGLKCLVDGELMHWHRAQAGRLGLRRARSRWALTPPQSLWRDYYSTRNYIFLMRERFQRPDLAWKEATRALLRSLAAWRRGPGYARAVAAMRLWGVRDGLSGRLGRRVEPGSHRHQAIDEAT